MARKKKEEAVEAVAEATGIAKLDMNLGREDLNAVVAKVNELVCKVNGCEK